jgi:RimJ/RimL family protein N-acetyltransferase
MEGDNMVIDSFEFELKDGRIATVRSPKEEDSKAMLEYLYKAAGETEFIIRYPEEWEGFTVEEEKAVIERINNSDNQIMLVCFVDGNIAGNCNISWGSYIKTRHRASVAIVLLQEYWNQGIGTRLFKELIKIAENNKYITQLELGFIEGNTRARALYEKMGFRIVSANINAFRFKDGTLRNEYIMIRDIKR